MVNELNEMGDDEIEEYLDDVIEIGNGRYVGLRTLLLALLSLLGYIGAVYVPIFTGSQVDATGLYNLTMLAFGFFFVKTAIPMLQK